MALSSMQASNWLKRSFLEGKQTYGAWQMLPGANISRTLARSGVDWVLVDCEHGNIDGASGVGTAGRSRGGATASDP